MNDDPANIRLREMLWRRDLTPSERAELQAWLAAHPEDQAEWDSEEQLTALVGRLPDVPVPSNFTSRVMQAVDLESRERPASPGWNWRRFLPRVAVASMVAVMGLFMYLRHGQDDGYRDSLIAISEFEARPSATLLEDFDSINRLGNTSPVDEELLALLQ